MATLPKISLFERKRKSPKRIAISKRRRRRKINYSQIDLATDSVKRSSIMCSKCAKTAKTVTFWTKREVKQKDSEYKNSSLVGQIDCESMKEKSKLLVKCFVNSFRKNPPISARNVPKLPEMSLFEPRKKSNKGIAISKLALQ